MSAPHYRKPGWWTRNVFNRIVQLATRAGVSLLGSRVIEVRGRKSGEPRQNPVNLLMFEGREYLVAPRGETDWVRNLRAANGELVLILGKKRSPRHAIELPDNEKVPVLRQYLRKWKAEVGIFFEGVGPDSSDDQIQAIAAKHPAFQLDAPTPA